MFSAHSEYYIRCNLTPTNTVTVSINSDFLLWRYLRESVDDRNEGWEPQAVLLATFELIAKLGYVLVTVDSLNLVVFQDAPQEEPALDVFYALLDDYFLAYLWSQEAHIPAFEVTQDQVQDGLRGSELHKNTELAQILSLAGDGCLFKQEILAHEIEIKLLQV